MSAARGAVVVAYSLVVCSILGALSGGLLATSTAGARQGLAPPASLELVAQDSWLPRSGRFSLQLRVTAPAEGYRVVGLLAPAVVDQAEVLAPSERVRSRSYFADLPVAAGTSNRTVSLRVVSPGDPEPARAPTTPTDVPGNDELFELDPGVYPLQLRLVDPDGEVTTQLVTHLPFLGSGSRASSGNQVLERPVGVLVDLRLAPQRSSDGRPRPDAALTRRLSQHLDALATFGDVPMSLQINPETVSALVATRAGTGGVSLNGLVRLAGGTARGTSEVLNATYVGFDEGVWLAGQFGDVLRAELDAGFATLAGAELETNPRLVALSQTADERLLARCFELGRDRIVLAQPASEAPVQLGVAPRLVVELPQQVTLPPADTPVRPAPGNAALGAADAYRVVAALLVDPIAGRPGGAQLRLHPQLDLAGAFASTLLRLLAQPGPLRASTISTLFEASEHYSAPTSWTVPLRQTDAQVLQRGQQLAGISAEVAGLRSLLDVPEQVGNPAGQRATRPAGDTTASTTTKDTTALPPSGDGTLPAPQDVVGDGGPSRAAPDTLADELEARLLLVPAAGLDAAEAGAILSGVRSIIKTVLGAVVLPARQSFRVTSHRATLPIVLLNEGTRPLRVAFRFSSNEVEFDTRADQTLVLQPGANDLEIPIRTRRSGEFTLTVDVTSPDGSLRLGSVPVEVQSRAISGVGLFLSIGALAFLIVWWVRNARRRVRGAPVTNASTDPHPSSAADPANDRSSDRSAVTPGPTGAGRRITAGSNDPAIIAGSTGPWQGPRA